MSEAFARAKALKERSKARTESVDRRKQKTGTKDYSESIIFLNEAIDLLLRELRRVEGLGANDGDADDITPTELASELADCYGMLGGVYRRAEDLDKSLESYDAGSGYEKSEKYGVENSYNMTNAIVVRILRDPQSLQSLRDKIKEAIRLVENQVEGKRKGQWWAWSDLGELRLLSGSLDDARTAYQGFQEKGARARDFESTISVLSELEEKVRGLYPQVAEGFADTILSLKQNKPLN